MIRAVLDTNVLASGFVGYAHPDSTPGELLRLWSYAAFTLIVSEPILVELERTLSEPYFARRLPRELRAEDIALLRTEATVVEITRSVVGVATHREDDLIIATALSAHAEFLVTGDRPLLKLASYGDVEVVSPRAFLDVLTHA